MSRPHPLHRLGHYLRVYREFVATSVAEATSYRAHFVLTILMELVFYATSLASIELLYAHVPRIGIWDRPQFLFFVAYTLAVDQLHMTLVSESFWVLGEDIRRGNLDYQLLRPLSLFFTVFFRHLRPSTLALLPVAWGLLAWYGIQAGLPAWAWVALPMLLATSFALLVAFEVLLSTLMFVTVEGTGINFLRMQFQTLGRWPDFVYAPGPRRLLSFVLPVLLVASAPVRILFDPRDSLLLLCMPVLLAATLWADRALWRRALAGYSSASS